MAAAQEEVAALVDLRSGRVRLAAFPSASATLVPAALARLTARAPGVDVRLTEVEPPEARGRVRRGEDDLAVVFAHEGEPDEHPRRVYAVLRRGTAEVPAVAAALAALTATGIGA